MKISSGRSRITATGTKRKATRDPRLEVHKYRLRELLKARLEEMIRSRLADEELEALAQKLRNRETDPYTMVADIVSRLEDGGHHD